VDRAPGGPKGKPFDPGHAVEADPDDPRRHPGTEALELLRRLELV
jgi:hypothetical protein